MTEVSEKRIGEEEEEEKNEDTEVKLSNDEEHETKIDENNESVKVEEAVHQDNERQEVSPDWIEKILAHTKWQVRCRYENLTSAEYGAYGSVSFADDIISKKRVAIKKLSRPFDDDRHTILTYRELHILKHVNHDNIIKLIDIFTTASTAQEMMDIYFVTNYMDTTLNHLLRPEMPNLKDDQIMFLFYQILRGLKYLHSCNIVHRDLKPSNITVNEECELRIIDFGMARTDQFDMTPYVVTRWYRAPDSILLQDYSKPVDIWAIGCILVELHTKVPLFGGDNTANQIEIIIDLLGYPSDDLLFDMEPEKVQFLASLNKCDKRRVDFVSYFSNIKNHSVIDLLEKIFQWNPNQRINSVEALEHEYVQLYHDSDDEPTGEEYKNEHENAKFNKEEWKQLIFEEIRSFKPQ